MTSLAAERARWEDRHATAPSVTPPSPFVERHARNEALRQPHGLALDLACGSGRHAHLLASLGLTTVAVDFSTTALAHAAPRGSGIRPVAADAAALPFAEARFDLIVQTCFLDRAIFPVLARLLAPGGLLVVETFTVAQFEATGHPRRELCLSPGELRSLCERADTALAPIDQTAADRGKPGRSRLVEGIAARRP